MDFPMRTAPRVVNAPFFSTLLLASSCFVFGGLLNGCQSAPDAGRANIQTALDAVYPALVRIDVVMERGGEGRMEKMRGTGSGTIISSDGYIVTNHHVAGRGTRISVRLPNHEDLDADLIGTDPLTDLSVLKIDPASRRDPSSPLPFARFGDSDTLKVGDVVLAMGSPAGLSQSVTKGIVANIKMISAGGGLVLDGENVGELVRWIGHDAVIFPGNSGGPLVNVHGDIIGVNEVGIGSLGGAIPSNLAKVITQELITRRAISRSWIGVEAQPLLKKMATEKGVLVATVLPDSPAKAAGILPGDFITQVNDTPVQESRAREDIPVFNRLVVTAPVGSTMTLKGMRDGKPMTWTLTTVAREPRLAKETEFKIWGITVRDFTRVGALENQRKDKSGVVVDSVRPGGPASESKPALRSGDILITANDKTLTNMKALDEFTREATRDAKSPIPVLVAFERDSQQLITVVRIGPEPEDEKAARPAKAWLGVQTQVLTRELAEAVKLEGKKGVRVTQIVPASPADKAGIKVGDIFLKLDGQEISASTPSDQDLFDNLIRVYKIGTDAEFEGIRAGQPLKLTVKLGTRPKSSSEYNEYKDDRFEFVAREMSLSEHVDEKLADNVQGLRISSVQSNGWAALAGLSSGDILLSVDGTSTTTVAQLKQMLQTYRESKPRRVVFFIKRGIYTFYAEIEPRW